MLQALTLKDGDGNWLSSVILDCAVIQTSLEEVVPDKIVRRDASSSTKTQKNDKASVTVEKQVINEIVSTDTGCLTPV